MQVKVIGRLLASQSRRYPPKYVMLPTSGSIIPVVLCIFVLSISMCRKANCTHIKKRGVSFTKWVFMCCTACPLKYFLSCRNTWQISTKLLYWWDPHRHANPTSSAELGIPAFSLFRLQLLKTWRCWVWCCAAARSLVNSLEQMGLMGRLQRSEQSCSTFSLKFPISAQCSSGCCRGVMLLLLLTEVGITWELLCTLHGPRHCLLFLSSCDLEQDGPCVLWDGANKQFCGC